MHLRAPLVALLLVAAIAIGSCVAKPDQAPAGYQHVEEAADGMRSMDSTAANAALHSDEADSDADLQENQLAGADSMAPAAGSESEAAEDESADPEVKHVGYWRRRIIKRRLRRIARRGGGRRGGSRLRRYFRRNIGRFARRRFRRLRSLANLLDGLRRETAACGSLSDSLRSRLQSWANRLKRFVRRLAPKNSTTTPATPTRAPETPKAMADDSGEDEDSDAFAY